MFNTNFELYLTIALVLGSTTTSALPFVPETIPVTRRNSASDAATSIQKATSSLICSLSYQAISAAYALGIGKSQPKPCLASTTNSSTTPSSSSISIPIQAMTPTITPAFKPTAGRTRTSTSTTTTSPPTSISIAPFSSSSIESIPIDIVHDVDPALSSSSSLSSTIPSTPSITPICTSSDPSICEFQTESLHNHNVARTIHHALPLIWSDKLREGAQRWADNCEWKHSGGSLFEEIIYGENLFGSTWGESSIGDAVDAFMAEESEYNYNKPGYSDEVGHFTQVVWKDTTSVGCATVNCDLPVFSEYTNSSSFIVCLYSESGNYVGEFAANVQAP